MKEAELLEEIFKAYPESRLFRNDNGRAFTSPVKPVRMRDGSILLKAPRLISYGLMPGSGDLIGWTPKLITLADVGKVVAQFTSIEAKTENDSFDKEGKQVRWFNNVNRAGGLAIVAKEISGNLTEIKP